MLRLRQKLISFSIVSNKIAHNPRDYRRDPTLNFYPVVGLTDIKMGTISLNQPNNQNFFTIEMIDELYRFLNSYQHDHTVENVWIENRGSMFLGGISYRELASNPDYLDKLYKMVAMTAKLNKPIFSFVTGGVRNVGAYVLSMASVALTDNSTSLRIDQVSKGFIPVGSGIHRLSRIPSRIGFYLALTGKRLSADQMARLGWITGISKQGVQSKTMRSEMSRSNLFFRDKVRLAFQDLRDQEWSEYHKILRKRINLQRQIVVNQAQIGRSGENIFAKFAMNQYRVAQVNYQNILNPWNSFTQKPGRTINNYFMLRHKKAFDYLQKNGLVEKSHINDIRLPGIPIDKILRVFGQDSLVDAIKVLENDQSEWGKQTLKALRAMDPLAAHLTFQMLRKADELSWDQCLELQYTIAKRLLAQSELTLKQTYSGSKYIFKNKYSQKRIQDLSIQQINQQFFREVTSEDQKLQLQVPKYALLPNADYKQIPDSARHTLNQIFFDDIHLSNQYIQTKRYLQQQKIDYRHKSFNIDLLRQKIHQFKQAQLVENLQSKRLEILVNNGTALRKYVDERFQYIDSIKNQQLSEITEGILKDVFNNGIRSRFEEFQQTAEVIGKEKKMQIFKNLRKTLIKKIVVNGVQTQNQQAQKNELFRGPLYFDHKGGSIHQTKSPHVKAYDPFNKLSLELQNRQVSDQYVQNQGTQPVDRHLGFPRFMSKKQAFQQRILENIARRYQQYPLEWQKAYEYKEMVASAAKTSQQLAQYLEWGPDAYYSTILNQPSPQRTYADVAQKYAQRMQFQRQQQKQQMRIKINVSQVTSKQYFSTIYPKQSSINNYTSNKLIKQQILPSKSIPKQLQQIFEPLFDNILRHFQEKYYKEALEQKQLVLGEFDKYIYENIDRQFVNVYKNDILFVYSYFAVLRMKEILHSFKMKGKIEKIQEIHSFFTQNGIDFAHDQNLNSINKIIGRFLLLMMDIHTYTKAKIRLPQNKLLDFLNRTKIYRQSQKKSMYPLSFQSMLLMIGKDRSKLYNKILQEYIPSEPQYLLEMSNKFSKDLNSIIQRDNMSPSLHVFENVVQAPNMEKKNLIAGYQYYLALFDSFIQRASGKYNFLNDFLLSINPSQKRKNLRNVLNVGQNNKKWLQRVLNHIIKNFFNVRLNFQKTLTKGQLLAFDQQLRQILSPQSLKLVLKYQVQQEIQVTKALFGDVRKYSYSSTQSQKNEELYCDIRRSVRNPDAFKRLNNLKMAMDIRTDYSKHTSTQNASQQEKEDLVDEKREFSKYQRFPKQTYRRIVSQIYDYGEQKNYDKYLNIPGDKEMDMKLHAHKFSFLQDENLMRKPERLTQFDEQIKSLKSSILKNADTQIQGYYKRIQQLI